MNKLVPGLLKLLVSAALLIFLTRGAKLDSEILPRLQLMGVHWQWTLAGLGCVGATMVLHAWRWQALLHGQEQKLPLGLLTWITVCASFFNLSPLGSAGGDAYRVLALLGRPGLVRLKIVVSIVLDHLVGLVSIALVYIAFAGAFATQWGRHPPEIRSLVFGFSLFMVGSLVFMVISVASFSPKVYAWGEQRIPRLLGHPMVKQFCAACDALRHSWRRSLEALVASIAMFLAHFMIFYCSARAIAEQPPIRDVFAAMPIVDGLAGLPISFAGLGVREKTFEALMGALSGMGEAAAISASLAGWLMQVAWALAGGLMFLWHRRSPTLSQ